MLLFEWNQHKAQRNVVEHDVTFEEARSVFYDQYAVQFYDNEHSLGENRFLILGLSIKLRLLMICHSVNDSAEIIRIISARKATRSESSFYRGGLV